MKGYYRRAEATARAFRGGYLHTGDRARLDGEGRITLLGRIDDMIIRGGINLYPQEIEAALNGSDGIRGDRRLRNGEPGGGAEDPPAGGGAGDDARPGAGGLPGAASRLPMAG